MARPKAIIQLYPKMAVEDRADRERRRPTVFVAVSAGAEAGCAIRGTIIADQLSQREEIGL